LYSFSKNEEEHNVFYEKTKPDTFIERLADGQYRAYKNENGKLEIQHKYLEQQVLKNL
jgi:hypothetical protein